MHPTFISINCDYKITFICCSYTEITGDLQENNSAVVVVREVQVKLMLANGKRGASASEYTVFALEMLPVERRSNERRESYLCWEG